MYYNRGVLFFCDLSQGHNTGDEAFEPIILADLKYGLT